MNYKIGIDIGATKIKGVVANDGGKILARREIETKVKRKRGAIISDIVDLIDFLKNIAAARHLKLAGIGVGAPGKTKAGKLIFGGGTLTQFAGFGLEKFLEKESGLKVFLENDTACFSLAESYFGAGKYYNRIAGIIWGTGIGGGIIDKKNRCRASVEIGHLIVEPNISPPHQKFWCGGKSEPKCACGARDCVENMASGKNIIRRYYAKGGKIKNAGIKEIYRSKEKAAQEVLEDAYKYLGMAIAVFIRATRPEIVVIGGGVSNLPNPAHAKLKNYIYKYAPKSLTKNLKIAKSKIGEFAGALGAAILVSNSGL